jgi:hypothetical protein
VRLQGAVQALLDKRAQRDAALLSEAPRAGEEVVVDVDGSFHMGGHKLPYGCTGVTPAEAIIGAINQVETLPDLFLFHK